jgi:hypothetical protein
LSLTARTVTPPAIPASPATPALAVRPAKSSLAFAVTATVDFASTVEPAPISAIVVLPKTLVSAPAPMPTAPPPATDPAMPRW